MKPTQHLIFKLGEESFPTVLSAEEEVNSPFADIIRHATQRLDNISELLDKVRSENDEKWFYETPNNIVALLGDRGSGKTSCMRTLVSNCRAKHKDWLIADEIDPSFFDDKHNVLDIFIGSLYGMFKQDTKNWQNKSREEQDSLRKIQEKFIQVKSSLRYISKLPNDAKINDDEYEIDSLNHLNNGGNLRKMLKELISKILLYKSKNPHENKNLLVLCIDDLDLNIKQSYVMMEHIRKYLIIPNVILIIAAKYNQLFDSVCLDLAGIYKNIDYRVSHKDIATMAERYLNKMLPLDQRLEMPQVESYMDALLHILDESGENIYSNESVKLRVPALIFEKTRFLFYNSSGMPSPVIPRNLRDLRMLVSMLIKMKPFSEDGAHNKRIFKDYFFKEWLGIIEPEYKAFVQSIITEENLAKINRLVISNLYDFFLSKIEPLKQLKADVDEIRRQGKCDSYSLERELLYNILNPANSFWNVSLGDVIVIINAVKKTNDSDKVLSLLFFIESLYSIKLYESYDKLTDMTGEDGIVIPDEATSEPELKSSVQGDMPEYFRLVGGSFFSLTGDYFTPLPQSSYPIHLNAREIRLINGRLLMNEIRKIEDEYDRLKKSKNFSLPPDLAARLRLCEFFMLTVTYREDLKSSDSNQRLINEPLYFKKFGNSVKNLIFDISAPFFNAIYPGYAYSRFSSKIFSIAKESKDSLLNRMAAKAHIREQDNPTWELMSKAAIRNMEVLQDLTSWLHDNRSENKPDNNGVLGVLSSFYRQFDFPVEEFEKAHDNNRDIKIPKGIYCVKTYDKTPNIDKLPYYYIEFSIYSLLGEVISEIISPQLPDDKDNTTELRNIFNGIMAADNIFIQKDVYTYDEIIATLTPLFGKTLVELTVGRNSGKSYSFDEMAQILAELRVNYRYDFNGMLPEPLLTAYNTWTKALYERQKSNLLQNIDTIKESLKDMSDELDQSADQIKQLQSDITQYKKDRRKADDDFIKFQRDMEEQDFNLEFFRDRLADGNLEKAEITRLRKEEEKAIKASNATKASIHETYNRNQRIKSQMKEASESLKNLKVNKKTIEKNIKEQQRKINELENDLQKLDQNMKNPRAVEFVNN